MLSLYIINFILFIILFLLGETFAIINIIGIENIPTIVNEINETTTLLRKKMTKKELFFDRAKLFISLLLWPLTILYLVSFYIVNKKPYTFYNLELMKKKLEEDD